MLFLINVSMVYAEEEDEVDLTHFPEVLADKFGISVFAGEIMATSFIVMLFLLPTLILTRNAMAHLIMAILALSLSIAIGWLGIWTLLIYCLSIAVLFGGKVRSWITGGK